MTIYNLCIRCGQQRITIEEWKEEETNGHTTKKSKTACPDQECQAKVDDMLLQKTKERERKEIARQQRLARIHQKQLEIVANI